MSLRRARESWRRNARNGLLGIALVFVVVHATCGGDSSDSEPRPNLADSRSADHQPQPTPAVAPNADSQIGGYKGAAWGTSIESTLKVLPPRKRSASGRVQDLRKRKARPGEWAELADGVTIYGPWADEPGHALTTFQKSVSAGQLGKEDPTNETLAAVLMDSPTLTQALRILPIGPGCGLFLQDSYFAQLNVVAEKLDTVEIARSLEEALGARARVIHHEGCGRRNTGCNYAFDVQSVESDRTRAMILSAHDYVATLYLDKHFLQSRNISRFIKDAANKRAEEESRAITDKTKARMDDL